MNARIPLLALVFCATAAGAQAPREVHGSHDAYAAQGIALAWGVLRGADEATTAVVIRVVVDPSAWLAVTGVDPFSKEERMVQRPVQAAGAFDVRIPRAHFADYPRTEFRLSDSATGAPKLVVYYLGVPDTTPEFADASKLGTYLSERIARARAAGGGKAP